MLDADCRGVKRIFISHFGQEEGQVTIQTMEEFASALKAARRVSTPLLLLTAPGATMPNEPAQNVLASEEPLPSVEDLKAIVRNVFNGAKMAGRTLPSRD